VGRRCCKIVRRIGMESYYENALVTIYHGDCLDILPKLEPADLMLTDPPYRGDFAHEGGLMTGSRLKTHNEINDDVGSSPDFDISVYMPILLKSAKSSLVWCSCKQLPDLLKFVGERFNVITWVKTNPVPLVNNKLLNDCEYCVCFLNKGFHYPDIPYKEKSTAYINKNGQDVSIDHPTPKPIEIILKNINQFSSKGESIIDPFCGSGTTGVGCMKMDRKCVLIDDKEKYCEMSAKRCEQAKTGLTFEEQDAGQMLLFEDK